MQIFILILIGIAGGTLAGMGMGGGTLLIPLLILVGTMQHTAQMVNLVAFIPMGLVVLILHVKNGLVRPKYLLLISLPATIISALAAYLIRGINGAALGRYFGIFLIVLGVYQLLCQIIELQKKRLEGGKAWRQSYFSNE